MSEMQKVEISRHGIDCYSRSAWDHECDCGLERELSAAQANTKLKAKLAALTAPGECGNVCADLRVEPKCPECR